MTTMRRISSALLLLATAAAAPAAAQEARPFLYQPAPSPDGSEIAFVSSGDIWVVPATGGSAHILVGNEADESRPLYSPDGTRLAFVSDRDGDDDIYVLTLASGEVRRLTWGDGNEELDAWSPDGRWIYFADGRGDPDAKADVWRVSAEGGTPMRVLADRFAPEFHASVSPDGRTLAIAAVAGMAQSQWWRHGHAHIDESEIWLATVDDPPAYRKLSESGSKNVSPMWSADGSQVVYVSDRSGSENLWTQPAAGGAAQALTTFRDGRLLFPTMSADGRTVAFERDFGIWRMSLPEGTAAPVAVTLDGAPQRTGVEHLSLTSDLGDLALSPDGKKVAFTARGEVFAASAKDGGRATRVTHTIAGEGDVTWAPDSRRIAYVSRRSGTPKLFLFDFGSGEERALTRGDGSDVTPRFSPDGARLAYVRNGREVHVLDVASGDDRRVAEGQLEDAPFTSPEPLVWSPDGKWLAYFATDEHMFTNVWVVPATGGEVRPVSELANSFAGSLAWSKDGKTIYFDTQQRTESGELARVDLVPRTPTFREDRFQDLFKEQKGGGGADSASAGAQATDSTTRIVFEDVHRRLELLPTGVDVGLVALSPDGKTLVFTASAEGQQNLYAYSVDPAHEGPRVTRQLTSTPGSKSLPRFTTDSKEVYYLDRGRIHAVEVASGKDRTVSVTAEMDVDFDQEKVEAFDEGWTWLRDDFYDSTYHGADWQAVRRTFEPYIRGAGTRAEYSRLMNMMVGELNASHLGHGVRGPDGPSTGELGVRFDRGAWESSGRLHVTEVVHLGPAHVAGIEPGDWILAVDGTTIAAGTNLDRLLQGKVGDKVSLRVADDASGAGGRDVSVLPITSGQLQQLAYRDWVEANRAYVDSVSGGRLGYVHMRDMGWDSYRRLVEDLDAENFGKEGVVIDIRNNHGGFVNAYALDVFSRRGYLTLEIRGYPETAARSLLGQRALEKPTVLVVNQHTLSDGEDFTEGYRTLGLGQVVGVPTAGWIIYTWGGRLVDGSSFRMPRSKVRGHDGQVMERNPRPVDVEVVRPMGESYTGRDSQLDAAVRALVGGR